MSNIGYGDYNENKRMYSYKNWRT